MAATTWSVFPWSPFREYQYNLLERFPRIWRSNIFVFVADCYAEQTEPLLKSKTAAMKVSLVLLKHWVAIFGITSGTITNNSSTTVPKFFMAAG